VEARAGRGAESPTMAALDDEAVRRWRAETPGCAERIHLNNAGAGLMPASVLGAVRDHLELEARVGGYEAADLRAGAIEACYADVARLIGAEPRNVAFVENATVAYAQALSAIPFEPGDVVVTTRNDYISNQLMFLSLARRHGVEVVRAPESPQGGLDVDGTLALIAGRRPRLVAVTQVPTNSGLVQPVEALGAACREHDAFYLVDACQSVGQMPVDARALGCDFLTTTSRKFLRGPRGAGFLFASDRVLEAGLEPLYIDMRGADWTAPDAYRPAATARRFENWEFAYALVLGTGAAARLATSIGLEAIRERSWGLAAHARERLSAVPGATVLDRGERRCAIVTVHLAGRRPEELHRALSEQGFNTSVSLREYAVLDFGDKRVDWAIRVSPHYYNTRAEVDAFVDAL